MEERCWRMKGEIQTKHIAKDSNRARQGFSEKERQADRQTEETGNRQKGEREIKRGKVEGRERTRKGSAYP